MRRLAFAAALLLAFAAPAIRATADELTDLQKEATQIASEKRQIAAELQQNLSVKRGNEQKIAALQQEDIHLEAQRAEIDRQRPGINSICAGTVPAEQMEAALARCNAALVPFNQKVTNYNQTLQSHNQKKINVRQSEEARVAAARRLLDRDQAIDSRLAFLQKRINVLQNAKLQCAQKCPGQGNDAAAQCLQECFDNAASGRAPVEATRQYQKQFGTRTPEQAIEEYKKSGTPRPGPNTLTTKPVPSPQ